MRAVIYARYSSSNQSEVSIEDQVFNCQARIKVEGWTLVKTYSDHAISGASLLRPGYQAMLEGARTGQFDIVIAEALDRLSRDLEDIAALYKQLSFSGVTLITLAEGEISELHVGLKGTMNALFLKDLAQKTRRGLAGRVRGGKSGGGKAYGYDVVRELGEGGEPVRGNLTINEKETVVIRRIFQDYVDGKSPRAIAITLNHEGVAGPSNKGWTASTIIGNRKRGTGILNNQLYVGKRIWNRLCYRRDPNTRKRVSQLNPRADWLIVDVPDLRIIENQAWVEVQALLEDRSRPTHHDKGPAPDWRHRRPKHLFSGLIKCAACGGGMTLISRVYYGCAANRNKGTCSNRLTLRLDRLEEAVLRGLQENLVTPELTEVFVSEYTSEINRVRAEASATHIQSRHRLDDISKRVANIVDAIEAGRSGTALLDKLEALELEKAEMESTQSLPEPEPVRLHPNIAEHYVAKVSDLRNYLNEEDARMEAAQILRSLVDEIRLHPIDGKLQIELIGDLASLLGFAETKGSGNKKPGSSGDPGRTKWLVAGARNHRELTLPPIAI